MKAWLNELRTAAAAPIPIQPAPDPLVDAWASRIEAEAAHRRIAEDLLEVVTEAGTRATVEAIEDTLRARGWRRLRFIDNDGVEQVVWMAAGGLSDARLLFGATRLRLLD